MLISEVGRKPGLPTNTVPDESTIIGSSGSIAIL